VSRNHEKKQVIQTILEIAQKKEQEFSKYSKDAQNRANEAEGAMISRYDTFKEEGQYLAEGLKKRHEELRVTINTMQSILETVKFQESSKVAIYSIVKVAYEEGDKTTYFLFPVMGGEKIKDKFTVITPTSPIGRALIGKEEGSEFQLMINNKLREGEIIDVT